MLAKLNKKHKQIKTIRVKSAKLAASTNQSTIYQNIAQ